MVSIRPEQLQFVTVDGLPGAVRAVMPLGAHVVYEIEAAAAFLEIERTARRQLHPSGERPTGAGRADVRRGLPRLSPILTNKETAHEHSYQS